MRHYSGRVMAHLLINDGEMEECRCYKHEHYTPDIMSGKKRTVSEWVEDSLTSDDTPTLLHTLGVAGDGCFSVLLEVEIVGRHNDYDGEYDEDMDFFNVSIEEVPPRPVYDPVTLLPIDEDQNHQSIKKADNATDSIGTSDPRTE